MVQGVEKPPMKIYVSAVFLFALERLWRFVFAQTDIFRLAALWDERINETYLVSTASIVLFMIVMLIAKPKLSTKSALAICSGSAIGIILLFASTYLFPESQLPFVSLGAGVLIGVGMGYVVYCFALLVCTFPIRAIFCIAALGEIVGILGFFLFTEIEPPLGGALTVLIPVLSLCFLLSLFRDGSLSGDEVVNSFEQPSAVEKREGRRAYAMFLVTVLFLCFAAAFSRESLYTSFRLDDAASFGPYGQMRMVCALAIAGVILWYSLYSRRNFALSKLYYATIILIMTALMILVPYFNVTTVVSVVASSLFLPLTVLLICLSCVTAKTHPAKSDTIIALGFACIEGATALGSVISWFAVPDYHNDLIRSTIALAILFGLIIVSLILFNKRSMRRLWQPADDERKADPYRDNSSAVSVESIAAAYHLSSREQEILTFILEDESIEDIAQALFIAKNTVKSHIGNIYTKMNVKSRRELRETIRKHADLP